MELKVKRVREGAILPHYAHPGDAGLDLFAAVAVVLEPACSAMVPTGIAIELPPRTEGQVRPRSGLAAKHQITVLNTPGTVDEGYRGEVCVILINHGRSPFVIAEGDKIAQLLVKPVYQVEVVACDELSDTSRGSGGFGSTGSRGKAE